MTLLKLTVHGVEKDEVESLEKVLWRIVFLASKVGLKEGQHQHRRNNRQSSSRREEPRSALDCTRRRRNTDNPVRMDNVPSSHAASYPYSPQWCRDTRGRGWHRNNPPIRPYPAARGKYHTSGGFKVHIRSGIYCCRRRCWCWCFEHEHDQNIRSDMRLRGSRRITRQPRDSFRKAPRHRKRQSHAAFHPAAAGWIRTRSSRTRQQYHKRTLTCPPWPCTPPQASPGRPSTAPRPFPCSRTFGAGRLPGSGAGGQRAARGRLYVVALLVGWLWGMYGNLRWMED
jgi:hypothetical protein